MEYDPEIALNLGVVLPVHRRPKQIDYKNQPQINRFCNKVMKSIPQEQMTSEIEGLEHMSKLLSGTKLDCEKHKVQIMKWFDHLEVLPKVEEDITMSKKFDSLLR